MVTAGAVVTVAGVKLLAVVGALALAALAWTARELGRVFEL